MDTSAFLAKILPAQGLKCFASPSSDGPGFRHRFFNTINELAERIVRQDARGAAVYHACAGFLTNERREQANVAALRALWLDLDCGAGKPHASQGAALLALKAFCGRVGLPIPLLVNSGHGIHAYWCLDADASRDDWQPVANLLKSVTVFCELGADPARTADAASILRPVGTHNRKGGEALPVTLLRDAQPLDLATIANVLQTFASANCVRVLHGGSAKSAPLSAINAEFASGQEFPPADAGRVAAGCAVMAHIRDTQGNVPEPLWYAGLSVIAYCEAADETAQEWSCGHPDYRPEATAAKLAQARQVKPTTCDHFRGLNGCAALCAACAHAGSSPISLGFPDVDGEPAQALTLTTPKAAHLNAANLARTMPRPRQWLFAATILRGAYTLLSAPGAAGKTALLIVIALSLATGRSLTGDYVHKRCKVLFISGEDGTDELLRRLLAAMQRYGITPEDIDEQLFLVGAGQELKVRLNTLDGRGRPTVDNTGLQALEGLLTETEADVVILDPLMSFVPGGVNDNAIASEVAGHLVNLCVRRNCAVVLSHHHSKAAARNGEADTANAAMGAAGWVNHARIACNIVTATETDAKAWGVLPSEVIGVFRVTDSKVNLSRKARDRIFKLEEERLPNGDPELGYPSGDKVQVVAPFVPPAQSRMFSDDLLRDILARLARGMPGGTPLSSSANSTTRGYHAAVADLLGSAFPNESAATHRSLAKAAVDELTRRGWLACRDVVLPRQGGGKGGGKLGPALIVIWSATPWCDETAPGPHVGEPQAEPGDRAPVHQ